MLAEAGPLLRSNLSAFVHFHAAPAAVGVLHPEHALFIQPWTEGRLLRSLGAESEDVSISVEDVNFTRAPRIVGRWVANVSSALK
jgi:hypothetical protein